MDERALDWGDTITKDEVEYTLLPEGDYRFRIESYERARFDGSEKTPPCNKAIVSFTVFGNDGEEVTINENFLLHTKFEWKLSQLFASVGLKKKGEPLVMDWPALPGLTGKCKIIQNTYTKDGKERTNNRIDRLYAAEEAPAPAFKPGAF